MRVGKDGSRPTERFGDGLEMKFGQRLMTRNLYERLRILVRDFAYASLTVFPSPNGHGALFYQSELLRRSVQNDRDHIGSAGKWQGRIVHTHRADL